MSTTRGIVRCGAAAVLFGASTPAASRVAGDLGAFRLAGLLYVGAAVATAPVLVRTPPRRDALRRSSRRLATAVVFGGLVGPVLLAAGLRRTSASTASLLLNLELVFTILVAALFLHEHVGRRVATGTAFVAAAGALLAWSAPPEARWGALLVAGACLAWAVDNSVTASIDQLLPAHITFAKGAFAGTANLAIGLALAGIPSAGPAAWALLVGAIGYGASITLWVAGARDIGAARGQLVFAAAPFVGALVSWTVLGEAVAPRQLAATALAFTGVAFVLGSGHEHEHRHDPLEHDHEHEHGDGHHDHVHPDGFTGRHQHPHVHDGITHTHAHVPDLHHRHDHN